MTLRMHWCSHLSSSLSLSSEHGANSYLVEESITSVSFLFLLEQGGDQYFTFWGSWSPGSSAVNGLRVGTGIAVH